jgi:hypothetical protein
MLDFIGVSLRRLAQGAFSIHIVALEAAEAFHGRTNVVI